MLKFTIKQFNQMFPDDEACLDWLRHKRWPEYIDCAKCQRSSKFHLIRGRKAYECDYCGYQISPTANTIMHKSRTSLKDWFYAIFVIANTRTGVSAKQVQREIGVTYKTAWRMCTLIRKLMDEEIDLLSGGVEVDETYVGGHDKNRHESKRSHKRGRGAGGKTIVAGVVERKGKIVAEVVPDVQARTLIPFINAYVLPASTIFSDEMTSYNSLSKNGYEHRRVHHAAKVYVDGTAHTNTIESFWSNTKRGMDGAHHVISSKYLQDYVNSYTYRWNHRDDETPMFQSLLGRVSEVLSSHPQSRGA